MRDKNFNNAKEIKISVGDKEITGRYIVEKGKVTVTSSYGQTTTQLGNSPAEGLARLLLSELFRKKS